MSRFVVRPLAILLPWLLALALCGPAAAQLHPPRLYVKPPERILADGTRADWPVTLPQITTDLLATMPPAATEVQLIFYWSQLCPTGPERCDFSIVDAALRFWAQHHKGVILGVETVSYPTRILETGRPAFTQATPDWVLRRVRTFTHHTRTIGQARLGSGAAEPDINAAFPVTWDEAYLHEVGRLIDALAERYDGNPALSDVIMTFGLNGEDLTFQDTPDLSTGTWIDGFERPIVKRYRSRFTRTALEFDMGFLGYLRLRAVRQRDPGAERAIVAFVDELIGSRVLLSTEGLSPASLQRLRGPEPTSEAFDLRSLLQSKAAGNPISIELWRPLSGPGMQDLGAIEAAIRAIGPDRLGLFNPTTNRTEALSHRLLHDLGYE